MRISFSSPAGPRRRHLPFPPHWGTAAFWPVFLQLTTDNWQGIAFSLAARGYWTTGTGRCIAFVSFLTPSFSCPTAPCQPVLSGVALLLTPGTLGPGLAWENAVLGHLLRVGDSHFAMPPLAGLADSKSPRHDPYKHSSLRHHRLLGDIEVPQLPLSAGAPGGTQHPKGMLNPSLNQALLAYFQACIDAIFSTLIFNPPSLSKPVFPNLKFPDAF